MSLSGGGDVCGFASSQFITAAPGANPATPAGIVFPQGLFEFTTTQCVPSAAQTFTVVYPQTFAPGTKYYKWGPTPDNPMPHWYVLTTATVTGNTATFTITDGGEGDDDLTANGTIVDQGGPGVPSAVPPITPVPTLSEWAVMLLSLMLAGPAALRLRRR